jgi:hypothetical protein
MHAEGRGSRVEWRTTTLHRGRGVPAKRCTPTAAPPTVGVAATSQAAVIRSCGRALRISREMYPNSDAESR